MRLMRYDGGAVSPVNLGNPIELTVNELVARVVAMTGSRSRIVGRPLPIDDPRRRRPDIGLAKELLGWTPKVSLEEGLKATIRWFAGDGARGAGAGEQSGQIGGSGACGSTLIGSRRGPPGRVGRIP